MSDGLKFQAINFNPFELFTVSKTEFSGTVLNNQTACLNCSRLSKSEDSHNNMAEPVNHMTSDINNQSSSSHTDLIHLPIEQSRTE